MDVVASVDSSQGVDYDSLVLRIALTCAGLALPLDAAITLPTSALNAFSLPAFTSATMTGSAAITSSTIFPIAPLVGNLGPGPWRR